MNRLIEIAKLQPHAAYTAYIHAEQHRYIYFLRTIDGIKDLLKPLDDIVTNKFIPALFGSNITGDEREIMSLPIKDGGLGLRIWHDEAEESYRTSRYITAPLQRQIINQIVELPNNDDVLKAKSEGITTTRTSKQNRTTNVTEKQIPTVKRNLEQLSSSGASSWLGAYPLKEQGFNLNKSEFQDALNLRYDKPLKNMPSKCACGKKFDVTHAMNCGRGGFIIARHDQVRNFEANLLRQVCNDVEVEPPLQSASGFTFHSSANTSEDARLDLRAKGFWRRGQNAFFDVRITNLDNNSQREKAIEATLKTHENEKKRQYNKRVMEIEHGTFTPIVLSIKGVMGKECQVFHKALAEKLSNKSGDSYEEVTRLVRVKLSFICLKSALLCIRGSRPSNSTPLSCCEDFSYNLNEVTSA